MKTIFLAINSQFSHTLLAPRYLVANCKHEIEIIETNVNARLSDTLTDIYRKKPDILAISCYIFNIQYVKQILQEIKLLLPNIIIILGGYEVSVSPQDYTPLCDYVLLGEGDHVFGKLIEDIVSNNAPKNKIIDGKIICNLDSITSPYTSDYCSLGDNRILYYESSRGCPFTCSYCMSGGQGGVRSFSMQRIKCDLDTIASYKPKLLKFVDRTFNYDLARASEILQHILKNYINLGIKFHFEIAPEIFNDNFFELLENAPEGLFQLEIGVQSYNKTTLQSINRTANLQLIDNNLARLAKIKNIHIHTDLIAGLPYEDFDSFVKGFNRLFLLKTNCLQLGFLKLLKGSQLYDNAENYVTFATPPYEIISSPWLDYDKILILKQAEEMLEMYYNSGRFACSMDFLLPTYCSPFDFFVSLSNFFRSKGQEKRGISANKQCDLLYEFCCNNLCNNITKEKQSAFEHDLARLINNDFTASGNTRKWKRHLD